MKQKLLCNLVTFFLMSCTHTLPHSEPATQSASEKTAAQLTDTINLNTAEEIILFHKNGKTFAVGLCSEANQINHPEGCALKTGSLATQVPAAELMHHFKANLNVPADYNDDMNEKNKVKRPKIPVEASELKTVIQRLNSFLIRYKSHPIASKTLNELQSMTDATAINHTINQIIDKTLKQIKGPFFISSKDKTAFEFYILKSYLQKPKLLAPFSAIKSGTFNMGSPASEKGRYDDEDLHQVTITHDFEMQATLITQSQYFLIMGYNPSVFKNRKNCPTDFIEINSVAICPNNPVESVSWNDTEKFINKLNEADEVYSYRLPTEAEWEYSTRAGSQSAYWFGDNIEEIGRYTWYAGNSGEMNHAIASKPANAWGIYDAHGNVWQWVADWYAKYPLSPQVDPPGPEKGTYRVVRGGCWCYDARRLRSSYRAYHSQDFRNGHIGIRLVRYKK